MKNTETKYFRIKTGPLHGHWSIDSDGTYRRYDDVAQHYSRVREDLSATQRAVLARAARAPSKPRC